MTAVPRDDAMSALEPLVPAYRVTAKIRNNRLWTAITAKWPDVTSQAGAARRLGMHPVSIGRYLTMKVWPGMPPAAGPRTARFYRDGWTHEAWRLALALDVTPDYLFDPVLYGRPIANAEVTIEATAEQLRDVGMLPAGETPEIALLRATDAATLRRALGELTRRQRDVLVRRYGLGGAEETLDEIGAQLGIGRARVAQIETTALARLRHPSRRKYFNALSTFEPPTTTKKAKR